MLLAEASDLCTDAVWGLGVRENIPGLRAEVEGLHRAAFTARLGSPAVTGQHRVALSVGKVVFGLVLSLACLIEAPSVRVGDLC